MRKTKTSRAASQAGTKRKTSRTTQRSAGSRKDQERSTSRQARDDNYGSDIEFNRNRDMDRDNDRGIERERYGRPERFDRDLRDQDIERPSRRWGRDDEYYDDRMESRRSRFRDDDEDNRDEDQDPRGYLLDEDRSGRRNGRSENLDRGHNPRPRYREYQGRDVEAGNVRRDDSRRRPMSSRSR